MSTIFSWRKRATKGSSFIAFEKKGSSREIVMKSWK
jgi:hypothetical protein